MPITNAVKPVDGGIAADVWAEFRASDCGLETCVPVTFVVTPSSKNPLSRQDRADDLDRLDSGEPLVEPLELEGESLVIHAEQFENRSVQVTDMHRILGDVV